MNTNSGNNKKLLFLIGMPRSGTKLLRDLLNRNRLIGIPETETMFWPIIIQEFGDRPDFSELRNRKKIYQIFKRSSFVHYCGLKVNEDDLKDIKSYNDFFYRLMCPYLTENKDPSKLFFIGDKTPNYIHHVDLLLKAFPNAVFLHIIRDPRNAVSSANKVWGKHPGRMATQWRNAMREIKKLKSEYKLNKNNYFEISYENLTEAPHAVLKTMCEFLHIPFNEGMLILEKPPENYGDAKGKKRIIKQRHEKFLEVLPEEYIKMVEEICYIEMLEQRYQPFYATKSSNFSKMRYAFWYIQDVFRIILFRLKDEGLKGLKTQFHTFKDRVQSK